MRLKTPPRSFGHSSPLWSQVTVIITPTAVRGPVRTRRSPAAMAYSNAHCHKSFPDLLLQSAIIEAERVGFYIDRGRAERVNARLSAECRRLAAELRELADDPAFNVRSLPALQALLFDRWGLPQVEGRSTAEAVLQTWLGDELLGTDQRRFLKTLLEYRGVDKLRSTYCQGILDKLSDDSRLRPNWNIAGTVTGRFSCEVPAINTLPHEVTRKPLTLSNRGCPGPPPLPLAPGPRPHAAASGLTSRSTGTLPAGRPAAGCLAGACRCVRRASVWCDPRHGRRAAPRHAHGRARGRNVSRSWSRGSAWRRVPGARSIRARTRCHGRPARERSGLTPASARPTRPRRGPRGGAPSPGCRRRHDARRGARQTGGGPCRTGGGDGRGAGAPPVAAGSSARRRHATDIAQRAGHAPLDSGPGRQRHLPPIGQPLTADVVTVTKPRVRRGPGVGPRLRRSTAPARLPSACVDRPVAIGACCTGLAAHVSSTLPSPST